MRFSILGDEELFASAHDRSGSDKQVYRQDTEDHSQLECTPHSTCSSVV